MKDFGSMKKNLFILLYVSSYSQNCKSPSGLELCETYDDLLQNLMPEHLGWISNSLGGLENGLKHEISDYLSFYDC